MKQNKKTSVISWDFVFQDNRQNLDPLPFGSRFFGLSWRTKSLLSVKNSYDPLTKLLKLAVSICPSIHTYVCPPVCQLATISQYPWIRLKFNKLFNEPVHEISNNVVCATIKASDQPAHTGSLIRAFASRLSIL